jgi:hypothetical protein
MVLSLIGFLPIYLRLCYGSPIRLNPKKTNSNGYGNG